MGLKEKIDIYLPQLVLAFCALLFLMPIIPRGLRPLVITLLLCCAIISAIFDKEKFRWGNFSLNSSIIFIYLISLLYTEDIDYGFRKISTASSILLFPLIFSLMSKRCIRFILNKRFELMWLFIIGTIILCVGSFLKFTTHYTFNDSILHFPNIIRSDISGWKIHPIYLSMHIGISMIFSLTIFNKGIDLKRTLILIFLNITGLFFLMIMIKKGPIIALVLVIVFLTLVFKNKKLYLISGIAAAAIISTIIFNPKVQSRFAELLQVQDSNGDMTNSTNIRYSIYHCAVNILPEAGVLGFGIGDGKNELINCYEQDAAFLAVNRYNSHNQYLGFILNVGYLGLFVFTMFILYHLLRAFSMKNYLLIAIILFYCIVMFSENILERENGVLFFAFFINFFIMLDWSLDGKEMSSKENLIKS